MSGLFFIVVYIRQSGCLSDGTGCSPTPAVGDNLDPSAAKPRLAGTKLLPPAGHSARQVSALLNFSYIKLTPLEVL